MEGIMRKINTNGFTLIELIVVTAILAVVLTGLVRGFIYVTTQSDMAANKALALRGATNIMEIIRGADFNNILGTYNNYGFTLIGSTGFGRAYVTQDNADLLTIRVHVCWLDRFGRVVGEDQDLDGILDGGEDTNGNGIIDSPVMISGKVTRKD